jgi:hypothetical protein
MARQRHRRLVIDGPERAGMLMQHGVKQIAISLATIYPAQKPTRLHAPADLIWMSGMPTASASRTHSLCHLVDPVIFQNRLSMVSWRVGLEVQIAAADPTHHGAPLVLPAQQIKMLWACASPVLSPGVFERPRYYRGRKRTCSYRRPLQLRLFLPIAWKGLPDRRDRYDRCYLMRSLP